MSVVALVIAPLLVDYEDRDEKALNEKAKTEKVSLQHADESGL